MRALTLLAALSSGCTAEPPSTLDGELRCLLVGIYFKGKYVTGPAGDLVDLQIVASTIDGSSAILSARCTSEGVTIIDSQLANYYCVLDGDAWDDATCSHI